MVINFWKSGHDHDCTSVILNKWPLAGSSQQHILCYICAAFKGGGASAGYFWSVVVTLSSPFTDLTRHLEKVKCLIFIISLCTFNTASEIFAFSVFMNGSLASFHRASQTSKGEFTQQWKFSQYLLSLMSLQTCMLLFLL